MSKRLKQTFTVRGMSCINCEAAVERALKELHGVYGVMGRISIRTAI